MLSIAYSKHVREVRSLYREYLKLIQDYILDHDIIREESLKIRQRFDMAKLETNPIKIEEWKASIRTYLTENKNTQPYYYPTSPNGTKYRRNPAIPQKIIDEGQAQIDEYNEKYVRYEPIKKGWF